MGTYIDADSVRRTCGIDSGEISDADVDSTITEVESQIPRFFNTAFSPTERIDILDGEGTNRLLLDKNPVLSVRSLKNDGNAEDVSTLEIDKESGYIYLGDDSTYSKFTYGRNKIAVKYLYGTLEHSTTSTTTSNAEVAGSSVTVEVASESGFTATNWVEIYGMDGHREVAQVSSTDTGELVLDQLVQTHEAGSTVVLLQINETFKKLMNIIASLALVARIVGQSYDELTGYTLTEFSVQKGEPYTQWRETATQLIKERDEIMARFMNRPYII